MRCTGPLARAKIETLGLARPVRVRWRCDRMEAAPRPVYGRLRRAAGDRHASRVGGMMRLRDVVRVA